MYGKFPLLLLNKYTKLKHKNKVPYILGTNSFNFWRGSGRKIAPNTGANATKFFTLATKSWKLVAKLATRIPYHTLPRDLVIVEDL